MDGIIDSPPLTDEDLTFSLPQFMQYLADVGRSNKCPVCPHSGEWIFHTTGRNHENMAVHALRTAVGPGDHFPVATMECPRCGFLLHTSLVSVIKHFRSSDG